MTSMVLSLSLSLSPSHYISEEFSTASREPAAAAKGLSSKTSKPQGRKGNAALPWNGAGTPDLARRKTADKARDAKRLLNIDDHIRTRICRSSGAALC